MEARDRFIRSFQGCMGDKCLSKLTATVYSKTRT
jgi:hypothetical protein